MNKISIPIIKNNLYIKMKSIEEIKKNHNIKLVFSDLDETLLLSNQHVPNNNIEAIQKAREKGVKFIITTGRAFEMIQVILEEIKLKNLPNEYSICYNGGLIIENKDNKILNFKGIPFDVANRIFKYGEKYDVCVLVFTLNSVCFFKQDPIEVERKKKQNVKIKIFDDYDLTPLKNEKIAKMMFAKLNQMDYLKKIRDEVEPFFKDELSISFSSNRYMEINTKGIDKGFAVKWMCDYLKIDIKDTMAIGDNYNDVSMIETAGVGIVVANGNDDVKKIASYVCEKTNSEGGVMEALEKFVIN